MPRSRGPELHQQQSPRAPLHLKTTACSEANSLHRMVVERSPKLEDGRSPRSPLFERKRGTRVADLETKLSKAQEELKKLRDQLATAEVAKIDAEQALEKAKKQVCSVTRTPEVDKDPLYLPLELEHTSEAKPQPEPEPKSEVENDSSPAATDVPEVVEPAEPLEELNEQKEEVVEKEKCNEDMETMIKKDGDCNIEGVVEEKVEEKSEPIDLPESLEVVKLKTMILGKEKEVEILLEENMIFKRRAEEEAKNLAAAARAKEEELKVKISLVEEELKESRARTAQLTEQLAAAEGAKATLEVEMKRLRVQAEQWRKATEAATALLATGDGASMEMGGRVAERCRSMDKHHGGYFGWGSPLMEGELEDGVVRGRRKAVRIRAFGDLWKKKVQQK